MRRDRAFEVHLLSQGKTFRLLINRARPIQLMLHFGISTPYDFDLGAHFLNHWVFAPQFCNVLYSISTKSSTPAPQLHLLWGTAAVADVVDALPHMPPSVHLNPSVATDSFHLHLSSLPKGSLWHQGEQCQKLMPRWKPSSTGAWESLSNCPSLLLLQWDHLEVCFMDFFLRRLLIGSSSL